MLAKRRILVQYHSRQPEMLGQVSLLQEAACGPRRHQAHAVCARRPDERLGNRANAQLIAATRGLGPDRQIALLQRQVQLSNRATARMLARKYESERYEAALDDAPFTLLFTGDRLLKRGGGGNKAWSAVSGKALPPDQGMYGGATVGGYEHSDFDYSLEAQKVADKGPIPEGIYWLDPTELHDMHYWHHVPNPGYPFESGGWGKHRITIHPHISTQTYGRGGFFIHGGDAPGSIGCIDLWDHMEDFVPVLEDEASRAEDAVDAGTASRGTKIELTVDYSAYRGDNHIYQL
jgi:hypothetical protein